MKRNMILGLGLLIAALLLVSCDTDSNNRNCISGEGSIVTREITLDNFSGIDIQGVTNVEISQGETFKIIAIGHSNIIDRVSTEVADDIWQVYVKGNCLSNYELKFKVTMPNLSTVIVSGVGNFKVYDFKNQGDLALDISGTGNIEIDQFQGSENLDVNISGSGSVFCFENWDELVNQEVNISGSGSFLAFPLQTQNSEITISSTGTCQISVEKSLKVSLSGSGSVQYKGSPSHVETSISGSGVVQPVN